MLTSPGNLRPLLDNGSLECLIVLILNNLDGPFVQNTLKTKTCGFKLCWNPPGAAPPWKLFETCRKHIFVFQSICKHVHPSVQNQHKQLCQRTIM